MQPLQSCQLEYPGQQTIVPAFSYTAGGYSVRIQARTACAWSNAGPDQTMEASSLVIALSAVLLAVYLWYDSGHPH